jgi:subtilisin family serine protease
VDVVAALRPGLAPFATFPGGSRPGATGSSARHRVDLDYQALTGTSVAAAHVAGTIALMQEAAVDAKGCFLTFTQVRQLLRDTATPMGAAAHEVGSGALDATAAVWGGRFAPPVSSRNSWECPG